jgi:hypothetical protein
MCATVADLFWFAVIGLGLVAVLTALFLRELFRFDARLRNVERLAPRIEERPDA